MTALPPRFDVATTMWQGARPYQEDALLQGFHDGVPRGFVVLADGMGGHASGDVASRLATLAAADTMMAQIAHEDGFERDIGLHLNSAVDRANAALEREAEGKTGAGRMGTTLVTAVLCENRLYWVSVGDSPLYLWRDGALRQLNEDHSLAPVIDRMVAEGELTAEAGRNHPDRNALTSVLIGEDIARIDLSSKGLAVSGEDVVILASDGLQYIDEAEIAEVLSQAAGATSAEIARALMKALKALAHPAQDNVTICVIRAVGAEAAAAASEDDAPDTRPLWDEPAADDPLDEETDADGSVPSNGAGTPTAKTEGKASGGAAPAAAEDGQTPRKRGRFFGLFLAAGIAVHALPQAGDGATAGSGAAAGSGTAAAQPPAAAAAEPA